MSKELTPITAATEQEPTTELFVVELEERLEMVQAAALAAQAPVISCCLD